MVYVLVLGNKRSFRGFCSPDSSYVANCGTFLLKFLRILLGKTDMPFKL